MDTAMQSAVQLEVDTQEQDAGDGSSRLHGQQAVPAVVSEPVVLATAGEKAH